MLNPIRLSLQNMSAVSNHTGFQTNPLKKLGLQTDVFEHGIPNISFTAVDNGPAGKAIRELGDVPCPYSGIPVLQGAKIKHLTSDKSKLEGSGKTAIEHIAPFEKYLQPVQKQAFHLLENLSKKNPDSNLRVLFNSVREENLNIVKHNEYKVFERIFDAASHIKEEPVRTKLDKFVSDSMDIIDKQDDNYIFRRRVFLKKLEKITNEMQDKTCAAELMKIAEDIPNATNDVSAFIVKFSQKDPSTKKEKTPSQIALALLYPSLGSIEHIKPRNGGGADEITNYIFASNGLNIARRDTPFPQWLEKNPEIPANMAKYMDAVIEKINNGAMKGYEAYPIIVAKTIKQESGGLIDLDTSKLKISKEEYKTSMERIKSEKESAYNNPLKSGSRSKNKPAPATNSKEKTLNLVA